MKLCEICKKPAEYEMQYGDDWDYSFYCEEHIGSEMIKEIKLYDTPKTFKITRFKGD